MVVWCTSPLPIAKTSKNVTHYLTYYFCPLLFYFYVLKGNHWQGRQRWCLYRRVEAIESTWENNANCGVLTPAAVPPKANRSLAVYWPHRPVSSQLLRAHTFHDTNAESHATLIPLSKTKQIYKVCSPSSARCREPGKIFFFFFSFVDDVSFLSPMACVLLLKKTLDV